MKYFNTKHEKDSAKITTLVVLILLLLIFVVGPKYIDPPEEYGVAVNFGSSAPVGGNVQPDKPKEIIEQPQKEEKEEEVEEEIVEEETEAETKEEEVNEEELKEEKAAEEKAIKEIEEAKEEALEAEQKLREDAEAAEKLKSDKEAKQKEEAEKAAALKAAKAKAEESAKAAEAKQKAEAKAAAEAAEAKQKAEAKAVADAKAAAEKKAREGTPFALLEDKPIYPGCEGVDNSDREKCMSDKIKKFIIKNFDTDLASEISGILKISISFKINTSGEVVNINAKTSNRILEEEAKRVIRLLPQMIPGMQQGKAVVVPYGFPIKIKLED